MLNGASAVARAANSSIVVTNATTGAVTFTLLEDETDDISPSSGNGYYFDVQWDSASGPATPAEGQL